MQNEAGHGLVDGALDGPAAVVDGDAQIAQRMKDVKGQGDLFEGSSWNPANKNALRQTVFKAFQLHQGATSVEHQLCPAKTQESAEMPLSAEGLPEDAAVPPGIIRDNRNGAHSTLEASFQQGFIQCSGVKALARFDGGHDDFGRTEQHRVDLEKIIVVVLENLGKRFTEIT